jgi:hypothetical protein
VFYNGVTLDDIHGTNGKSCSNVNGIGAWSEQGIVGRGVLLDYHEWRLAQGREHDAFATSSISLGDLKAVAKAQGTEVRFGDILLVRSGYMHAYNRLDKEKVSALREKQPPSFAGVEQSEEMLQFMWENFAACAGDHPSWYVGLLPNFALNLLVVLKVLLTGFQGGVANAERMVMSRGNACWLGHANR